MTPSVHTLWPGSMPRLASFLPLPLTPSSPSLWPLSLPSLAAIQDDGWGARFLYYVCSCRTFLPNKPDLWPSFLLRGIRPGFRRRPARSRGPPPSPAQRPCRRRGGSVLSPAIRLASLPLVLGRCVRKLLPPTPFRADFTIILFSFGCASDFPSRHFSDPGAC